MSSRSSPRKSSAKLKLPELPREQWCDFRIKYMEQNRNLVQLAEEYMCDPRTVRSCLLHNKPSTSLGKKTSPTRIDLCRDEIREVLQEVLPNLPEEVSSTYQLSRYLLPLLQQKGYTGSERTLRNHLHHHPGARAALEKKARLRQLASETNENST